MGIKLIYYDKHVDSQNGYILSQIIIDQILITVQDWCCSIIYIIDHQNNGYIALAMSDHL